VLSALKRFVTEKPDAYQFLWQLLFIFRKYEQLGILIYSPITSEMFVQYKNNLIIRFRSERLFLPNRLL
jgi:hypothetical protein